MNDDKCAIENSSVRRRRKWLSLSAISNNLIYPIGVSLPVTRIHPIAVTLPVTRVHPVVVRFPVRRRYPIAVTLPVTCINPPVIRCRVRRRYPILRPYRGSRRLPISRATVDPVFRITTPTITNRCPVTLPMARTTSYPVATINGRGSPSPVASLSPLSTWSEYRVLCKMGSRIARHLVGTKL